MHLLRRQNIVLRRLIAFCIDAGMFLTPLIIAMAVVASRHADIFGTLPQNLTQEQIAAILGVFGLVFVLAFSWPAYHTFWVWRKGATLGKWVVGLRIVRADDHTPVGFFAASGREFSRMFIMTLSLTLGAVGLALGVSILLAPITVRTDGRLTNDLIAGTVVVDESQVQQRTVEKGRKSLLRTWTKRRSAKP